MPRLRSISFICREHKGSIAGIKAEGGHKRSPCVGRFIWQSGTAQRDAARGQDQAVSSKPTWWSLLWGWCQGKWDHTVAISNDLTQSVSSSSPAAPLTHATPSGARPGWAETRPPAPLQRSTYFSAAQISTRSSDFENELKETRRSRLFNIQQEWRRQ